MPLPPSQRDPRRIREMFGRLSGRYDLMNNIITMGRVGAWRKKMFEAASLAGDESILDVGTGTGAIARRFAGAAPDARVTASDFSKRMIETGRYSPGGEKVLWCLADALWLPFADESFDLVTSGYLVRNVADLHKAFSEQARVLKPGGVLICLETCPPPRSFFRPFLLFYIRYVLPLLGRMVAGSRGSYAYLARSTEGFETPEGLAGVIEGSGLVVARTDRLMFGTQVLVTARKT